MENYFDDIRPYNDDEINATMHRITANPLFKNVATYIYPDKSLEDVKTMFCGFNSIHDFQIHVMYDVIMRIMEKSIKDFSYSGMEHLNTQNRYLFISNHRDIALDATLLQYILNKEGHETSEISFGDNLMHGEIVVDLGKSNKMFKLVRGGSPREILNNSIKLSKYLRHCLYDKHQSAWIAQRNGRTKNGYDLTEKALVKMLNIGGNNDIISNISELNIVPMSVSYQYEPCDIQKARELYISISQKYVKKPGEDLESILSGILEPKGDVHYSFAAPITKDALMQYESLDKNGQLTAISDLLDKRICLGYKLWNTNYIAYDILNRTNKYSAHYSIRDREYFLGRMEQKISYIDIKDDKIKEIFLNIYAAPVMRLENQW